MLGFIKNYLTKQEGKKHYEDLLTQFLSDNKLSDEEKKELDNLAKKYELSKDELLAIQKRGFSFTFSNIGSDKRITEEEKKALGDLLDYFKIKREEVNFDQNTFNKYYVLALLDKGIMPDIKEHDLNIIFKKGEVLHWACASALMKYKRVTERINYGGLTASIKIVKGLHYRTGSINVASQTNEYLIPEDFGGFWLTNERVGFQGKRKNFAFPYSKIHSFELTTDGLLITKQGKDTPYIIKLDDYDIPCTILSKIVNK